MVYQDFCHIANPPHWDVCGGHSPAHTWRWIGLHPLWSCIFHPWRSYNFLSLLEIVAEAGSEFSDCVDGLPFICSQGGYTLSEYCEEVGGGAHGFVVLGDSGDPPVGWRQAVGSWDISLPGCEHILTEKLGLMWSRLTVNAVVQWGINMLRMLGEIWTCPCCWGVYWCAVPFKVFIELFVRGKTVVIEGGMNQTCLTCVVSLAQ